MLTPLASHINYAANEWSTKQGMGQNYLKSVSRVSRFLICFSPYSPSKDHTHSQATRQQGMTMFSSAKEIFEAELNSYSLFSYPTTKTKISFLDQE